MAVIPGLTTYPEKHVQRVQWSTVIAANTFGVSQVGSRYPDRAVQVEGTFNGATVVLTGSYDGTNYHTLNTAPTGTASYAAAGMNVLVEAPPYLQCTHSGGGGSESVTVTVYCVSNA